MRLETAAVHAGRTVDPGTGAVAMPIHLSTTFERDADGGYSRGFEYVRDRNPNRDALEVCLKTLEQGHSAVGFASGMAAIAATIEALPAGASRRIILPNDMYYGMRSLISDTDIGARFDFTTVDMTDLEAVEQTVTAAPAGLLWLETPSNPLAKVVDIAAIAAIARQAGAVVVVDNTWATPVLQRPLTLGADFVIHAATKYIGGHSDLMLGIVVARTEGEMLTNLRNWQKHKGGVPAPFDCWLALRGVQTLAVRMAAHCANAASLARFLDEHPAVAAVHYPGLITHPGHEIARRQMDAFGGMLSFEVKGGREAAMAVAAKVKLFIRATSLGGVHSVIEHRASIEGPKTMAPPGLLRVSVGLEHRDDLIADIEGALG